MKTPSTWEEFPTSLKEDAELFCVTYNLRPGEIENLHTLIRIAFHEGAIFGIEQAQARFKA